MPSYGLPVLKVLPDAVLGVIAEVSIGIIVQEPIACGEQFVAAYASRSGTIMIYDLTRPDTPLATLQASGPVVAIDEAKQRAVVSSINVETMEFQTVDLATGVVRPELSLRHDKEGGLPWAIYEDLLFVGRDKDLVIYDLAKGKTMAYLKDFVLPHREGPTGANNYRIQHLIVDEEFSRLIAVTRDGHRSRVVALGSLLDDLGQRPPAWSKLDSVLADDSSRN